MSMSTFSLVAEKIWLKRPNATKLPKFKAINMSSTSPITIAAVNFRASFKVYLISRMGSGQTAVKVLSPRIRHGTVPYDAGSGVKEP